MTRRIDTAPEPLATAGAWLAREIATPDDVGIVAIVEDEVIVVRVVPLHEARRLAAETEAHDVGARLAGTPPSGFAWVVLVADDWGVALLTVPLRQHGNRADRRAAKAAARRGVRINSKGGNA